jgi:hypothetical protein
MTVTRSYLRLQIISTLSIVTENALEAKIHRPATWTPTISHTLVQAHLGSRDPQKSVYRIQKLGTGLEKKYTAFFNKYLTEIQQFLELRI